MASIDGGYQKAGILDALSYFGLDHIDVIEKTEMRDKFISGKTSTPGRQKNAMPG